MEVLPNMICHVALPNGHRIQAHRSSRLRREAVALSVGDRVMVEMSPYDMSIGRIVNRET
jgi:translation initiation factor IF-1